MTIPHLRLILPMTILFSGLTLMLTGCASLMSPESVNNAFDACQQESNERNYKSKLIYCNIAIHSGQFNQRELSDLWFWKGYHMQSGGEHRKAISAFNQALEYDPEYGQAYYYRGWSLRELGNLYDAEADFAQAARYDQRREFRETLHETQAEIDQRLWEQEEAERIARNRPVKLVFNGLWCPKVQRDSIVYPANELIVDIVVTDQDGRTYSTSLPAKGKAYNGIKAGSTRRVNKTLWSGPAQPLTVQITLWEYDDGGPLVEQLTEIAIDFALTRGSKTMAKYAVKQGVQKSAAYGGRKALSYAVKEVDLSSQLTSHISSLPKALVGANNDLVGAIGIANVSPEAYSLSKQHGFSYHFSTINRGGGADCRLYFEFK